MLKTRRPKQDDSSSETAESLNQILMDGDRAKSINDRVIKKNREEHARMQARSQGGGFTCFDVRAEAGQVRSVTLMLKTRPEQSDEAAKPITSEPDLKVGSKLNSFGRSGVTSSL